MKEFLTKMVSVKLSDRFEFRCRMCGACCRHVKESVPMETLDAFRLAKFLRNRGEDVHSVDNVLAKYTVPVLLHESGYMIFMIKTIGPDDACIFLKDNRCTIHGAKPRACRTYPLSVGPDGHGAYEQYLSMEQPQHFNGPQISVKKWIQKRCSVQDREFWNVDVGSAKELADLLGKIPQERKKQALILFMQYKYFKYDLDKSFTEQYKDNNQMLLDSLRIMADETEEKI